MARKRRRTRRTRSRRRNPTEVVVARIWKGKSKDWYNDGILLFPRQVWDRRGHVMSWERVGQHGGADYAGVISKTRPATHAEATKLIQLYQSTYPADDTRYLYRYRKPRTRNAAGYQFMRNIPPHRYGRYPNPAIGGTYPKGARFGMRGSDLHPADKQHVLAAYIYRMTTESRREHPEATRQVLRGGYRMPERSDAQWLRDTYFRVTKYGRLKKTRGSKIDPKYMFDVILEPTGRWPTANPRRRRRTRR